MLIGMSEIDFHRSLSIFRSTEYTTNYSKPLRYSKYLVDSQTSQIFLKSKKIKVFPETKEPQPILLIYCDKEAILRPEKVPFSRTKCELFQ